MYQAMGRAVRRNLDNTLTVKVDILDTRRPEASRLVRTQEYKVAGLSALAAAIRTDLLALQAGEQDAALNAAVVGVILGEV